MSTPRGRVRRRRPRMQVAQQSSPNPAGRWIAVWLVIVVVTVAVVLVAERTSHGRSIVSSVQQFLLFYMGVFALIGLTAAVGVGLLATDRIVMRPGTRVVAQAVHRGVSLAALTALAAHVVLEILAHRSHVVDALVPFLAQRRTLYMGLGTVASDLVVLIVVTGFLRGRFATRWPWAWRAIHGIAYLAWPLSVVHGLMAGRTAKPYVDWSYGACLAAVALALAIRSVATVRTSEEKLAHPVPDRLSAPADGLMPGARVTVAPLGPVHQQRALPSGRSLAAPGDWSPAPDDRGERGDWYSAPAGTAERADWSSASDGPLRTPGGGMSGGGMSGGWHGGASGISGMHQ